MKGEESKTMETNSTNSDFSREKRDVNGSCDRGRCEVKRFSLYFFN